MKLEAGACKKRIVALLAMAGLVLVVSSARAEDEESYVDVDSCSQVCESEEGACLDGCAESDDQEACEEACTEEADACYQACE